MIYKLGETKTEIQVENSKENKDIALAMAQQAHYSIDIFSQDLDAEIYDNEAFERCVFKLAKRHPNTKTRILVQDTGKAAQNGHYLTRLAQSISSSVFIHTPSADYKDEPCAFMVVDRQGFIYRKAARDKSYIASASFMSPQRAGELSDFFDLAWEHSTPDVQTRRIYV